MIHGYDYTVNINAQHEGGYFTFQKLDLCVSYQQIFIRNDAINLTYDETRRKNKNFEKK